MLVNGLLNALHPVLQHLIGDHVVRKTRVVIIEREHAVFGEEENEEKVEHFQLFDVLYINLVGRLICYVVFDLFSKPFHELVNVREHVTNVYRESESASYSVTLDVEVAHQVWVCGAVDF